MLNDEICKPQIANTFIPCQSEGVPGSLHTTTGVLVPCDAIKNITKLGPFAIRESLGHLEGRLHVNPGQAHVGLSFSLFLLRASCSASCPPPTPNVPETRATISCIRVPVLSQDEDQQTPQTTWTSRCFSMNGCQTHGVLAVFSCGNQHPQTTAMTQSGQSKLEQQIFQSQLEDSPSWARLTQANATCACPSQAKPVKARLGRGRSGCGRSGREGRGSGEGPSGRWPKKRPKQQIGLERWPENYSLKLPFANFFFFQFFGSLGRVWPRYTGLIKDWPG